MDIHSRGVRACLRLQGPLKSCHRREERSLAIPDKELRSSYDVCCVLRVEFHVEWKGSREGGRTAGSPRKGRGIQTGLGSGTSPASAVVHSQGRSRKREARGCLLLAAQKEIAQQQLREPHAMPGLARALLGKYPAARYPSAPPPAGGCGRRRCPDHCVLLRELC